MKRIAWLGSMLLVAAPTEAWAQGKTASSPVELTQRAANLKPGEWVWAPEIAPTGPIMVVVDLSTQVATVYRNGLRIGVSTVSTGKKGHETPTGVFKVSFKEIDHRSSIYNNARMPYTQRFTMDGVALHAGGLPGYPESHGCVHLPLAFAKLLYGATSVGMTIVVAGKTFEPGAATADSVLSPDVETSEGGGSYFSPEKSPSGPVAIVVSRSDQAAVILRNGVEIGRTRISIPKEPTQTAVLTLASGDQNEGRWIFMGVPGHDELGGQQVSADTLKTLMVPRDYFAKVKPLLVPGTTVLVTMAPIGTGDTGKSMTVLSGDGK